MKKLFLIVGLLISLFSQAQRLGQPLGALNGLVFTRGSFMADQGLIISRLDTLNHPLKDSVGALTFWQNKLWLRTKISPSLLKWVEVGTATIGTTDGNNYPTTLSVTGTTTKTIILTLLDGSVVTGTFNDLNTGIALTNYYTKAQTDSAIAAHSSSGGVNADWSSTSGLSQILNKPTLSTVASTGSYNDLTNKPTINFGTVSLVTKGFGIKKDGDITTTGTINADSTVLATVDRLKKDSAILQSQITSNTTNIAANTTSITNNLSKERTDSATLRAAIPLQFNPIAGTNMSITGTYPNMTFNAATTGTIQTTSYQTATATASQTAFVFTSVPSSLNDFWIDINGMVAPQSVYTKSINTITFSSGMAAGDVIGYHQVK